MSKPPVIAIICTIVIAALGFLLIGLGSRQPQIRLSTIVDTALGETAAAKAGQLAPAASIVLIAYADEDDAGEAALRRRDAFLLAAKRSGLKVAAVISPIAAYRGRSEAAEQVRSVRESGIDETSVKSALALKPDLIVSLEGSPVNLGASLGRTRFFVADPYASDRWMHLMQQGQLLALLACRKIADGAPDSESKDTTTVATERFVLVTPDTYASLRGEIEMPVRQ